MLKWKADASSLHEIAKVLDDQTFSHLKKPQVFLSTFPSLCQKRSSAMFMCVFYLRMIDKLQML